MKTDLLSCEKPICDLNALLTQARDAYYKAAAPIMSDFEYDTKEALLRALVKAHPEHAGLATVLQTVGSDATNGGRVVHTHPMLSIENKYDKREILEFFRTLPQPALALEPKRDGISCELRYAGHQFVQALTRGDGKSGEDITAQVKAVASIPKVLLTNLPGTLAVRGELVMANETLVRINKEAAAKGERIYTSTRNLAAGTMKLKDINVVATRDIQFRPWDVLAEDGVLPDSGVARLELLALAGFSPYDGLVVTKPEDVLPTLELILAKNAKSNINADGVVAKADSHKARRKMGNGSKVANYQVCFKPQSASAVTTLLNVVWQVGRQGKVTPVAACEAVVLAGASVTRAALNNISWINDMNLTIGAQVEMLRSGDVIPQIIGVIADGPTKIVAPTHCPECNTLLEEFTEPRSSIVTHWCQNGRCPGRTRELLTFVADRNMLEIDGLGPEMASRLINEGYVKDLADLFEFGVAAKQRLETVGQVAFEQDMLKKGFSGAATVKMVLSLEKAKTADWDRWIAAMSIPNISRSTGKDIAKAMKLKDSDMANLPAALLAATKAAIEGIGLNKSEDIIAWAQNPVNVLFCQRLAATGVKPHSLVAQAAVPGGKLPLEGLTFCITGEFTEDRPSLYKKLESLGAVGKTGVSSKCNLLIVGEGAGKSKLQKASSLGVKQVGKDWLVKALHDNGLTMQGEGSFEVEDAE